MQFQKKRPKNVIYLTQQKGCGSIDCIKPQFKNIKRKEERKMKKKIIVFTLICTLLLICNSILCVCANGITSQATFDGNIATISGTVTGASGATQVTLLVGEPGDIIYVDQVTSEADGSFSFEVPFSSSTPFGEYPYRIGSGARVGTYEGVIDYRGAVTYVTNQFLTADLNVSVNAYMPTITGTISCTEGKTVDVTVTNVTDNTVIAEETITAEDGEHAVSYTLPTLMSTKEYSLVVTVNDGSTQQVALNVSIDCKVLSVEAAGTVNVSENTWLDMQVQSVGSDLINKSGTVTASKEVSLEIPNLVAYAEIDVLAKGYETVVRYEENTPTEPDDSEDEEGWSDVPAGSINILSTECDSDGIVKIVGEVTNGKRQITCLVTNSTSEIVYIDQKETENSGAFSFEFSMPSWAEQGTYTAKFGGENIETSVSVTIDYKSDMQEDEDIDTTIFSVIDVSCESGKEYDIVLFAQRYPTSENKKYIVNYDPLKLKVLDLCSLTYTKELNEGQILNTDLEIINFDEKNGTIIFKHANNNLDNNLKILNCLKFKSLVSNVNTLITIR